jgi:hypothetical protein
MDSMFRTECGRGCLAVQTRELTLVVPAKCDFRQMRSAGDGCQIRFNRERRLRIGQEVMCAQGEMMTVGFARHARRFCPQQLSVRFYRDVLENSFAQDSVRCRQFPHVENVVLVAIELRQETQLERIQRQFDVQIISAGDNREIADGQRVGGGGDGEQTETDESQKASARVIRQFHCRTVRGVATPRLDLRQQVRSERDRYEPPVDPTGAAAIDSVMER